MAAGKGINFLKKTIGCYRGEFQNQEIWEYVKLCSGEKSPSPDGYTMAFYMHCWEVVWEEVIVAATNFQERCFFKKSFPMWR